MLNDETAQALTFRGSVQLGPPELEDAVLLTYVPRESWSPSILDWNVDRKLQKFLSLHTFDDCWDLLEYERPNCCSLVGSVVSNTHAIARSIVVEALSIKDLGRID